MNPRDSALFIASIARHVKINPAGVKKIAFEVLPIFYLIC